MTQRNFDAQIAAVLHLSVPNRWEAGHYEIETFEVEEVCNCAFVKRIKRPIHDGAPLRLAYHECFKVGPRGAVKPIYSSFY